MGGLPGANTSDIYAKRAADSLSVYNAEQVPPATSYAGVRSRLSSALGFQNSRVTNKNSAVVSRKERLQGLFYNWAWGGNDMYRQAQSLPQSGPSGLDGQVNNSTFQKILVQLHDWSINSNWYIAYPMAGAVFNGSDTVRGTYPSFRVSVIQTNTSGASGPSRMTPTPRFTAVQRVPKYSSSPRYYSTVASNATGAQGKGGASSNVNTPGNPNGVNTPGIFRGRRR